MLLSFFGPQASAAPGTEPKTHVLFLSSELEAQYNGGLYHVESVVGSAFIIRVHGQPVRVRTGDSNVALKLNRTLTLAAFEAAVEGLLAERAYSPGHDPERLAAIDSAEASAANQLNASVRATTADVTTQTIRTRSLKNPLPGPEANQPNPAEAANVVASNNAAMQVRLDQQTLSPTSDLAVKLASQPYDAIRVSFTVHSPHRIERPYVVMEALFRNPGAATGSRLWIGAGTMAAIGDRPVHFHLLQGGFPPGYTLLKTSVHLYDEGGGEVATNVAEDRMALTREEAFSYLVSDYLAQHKAATLPATTAMTALPADWRSRPESAALRRTYFVKVDRSGHPGGAFKDSACSIPVDDPYVGRALMNFRFRPALNRGHAVEGVAKINPAELLD